MKILMAIAKQEEEIAGQILKLPLPDTRTIFLPAFNEADALSLLFGEQPDFIITSINIPQSRSLPLQTSAERGLAFATAARAVRDSVPIIILSDYVNNQLFSSVQELTPCHLVLKDSQWLKVVRAYLSSSRMVALGASVDISLDESHRIAGYQIRSPRLNRTFSVLRNLDFANFEGLIRETSEIVSRGVCTWESRFRSLGLKLHESLFSEHPQFASDIAIAASDFFESPEDVTMRFIVERSLGSIALEALCDYQQQLPRMLDNPTFRKIRTFGIDAAKFDVKKADRLRCLIVPASGGGVVPGYEEGEQPLKLRPLPWALAECQAVETYLKSKGVETHLLWSRERPLPSLDDLEAVLGDKKVRRTWHMFHFAGHSYRDLNKDETGVLFLAGKTGPVPVGIDVIASLLREARVRFVYLSSCSSATCAYELAEQQVASILGYHWNVSDRAALVHATTFYRSLFDEHLPVERAVHKTRKYMFRRHRRNPIWAASVLVNQTER
jgi:hypothetical protein